MNMILKYFILKMFNIGLIINTNANRSAQIKCSGDMGCGYMGGWRVWQDRLKYEFVQIINRVYCVLSDHIG